MRRIEEKKNEQIVQFKNIYFSIHAFQNTFSKQITKDQYVCLLSMLSNFSTQNNEVMYTFISNQFVTAVILKHFLKTEDQSCKQTIYSDFKNWRAKPDFKQSNDPLAGFDLFRPNEDFTQESCT